MAKFRSKSNGAEVEALRWLSGNDAEIHEFAKKGFAVDPTDPTKGVLFGLSHDNLTGQPDGHVWFPLTSGDWVVEFTQAGHPIYLAFTDDEMQGKTFTELKIKVPPVEETPSD